MSDTSSTAVSICANALIMLGESPINSFDDATSQGGLDRARIARNLWPSTRDMLLRSHPWNCAMARVALSPDTSAPAFTNDFAFTYTLPGDPYWLRNHEINGVSADEVDYVVEGRNLLCNEASLRLRYVFRNTDVGSWDPMLVYCAEYAMAMRMAYPVTQSDEREKMMANQLFEWLKKARAVDGQDDSPAVFGSFPILNARRGVGYP